jgi:hypothetical protein
MEKNYQNEKLYFKKRRPTRTEPPTRSTQPKLKIRGSKWFIFYSKSSRSRKFFPNGKHFSVLEFFFPIMDAPVGMLSENPQTNSL